MINTKIIQEKSPILSICIPTYNRCEILEKTILSIISQEIFIQTDYVEIVISDNCSIDNTEHLCADLVRAHPGKVRYFKNSENIKDHNFFIALKRGNGKYLKLNNDTLKHEFNSLELLINEIISNEQHTHIVFSNQVKNHDFKFVQNPQELVHELSYWITWIACFGLWKRDLEYIEDYWQHTDTHLAQVVLMLKLVKRKNFKIVHFKYAHSVAVKPKGDVFKIFILNYMMILGNPSFEIDKVTLETEKRIVFESVVLKGYIDYQESLAEYEFPRFKRRIVMNFSPLISIVLIKKVLFIDFLLLAKIEHKIATCLKKLSP